MQRSTLYLRILPRRSTSLEGKRHVNTVPVKIKRSSNSLHKKHQDGPFTFCTRGQLDTIVGLFGNDNIFVVSTDDKAKVPLGITAAVKQSPLLMHIDYQVRLPDHDFIKAKKHKLTPSVYAGCAIKKSSSTSTAYISYSGPMYIAVRSGKHDSSTAFSHGQDFDKLIGLPQFKEIAHKGTEIKPIVLNYVDGGSDENVRWPKTLAVAVDRFKKYNLDAYIAITHAPGMSAFNFVERRMAPLSKELAGVVIPHDVCGTHLDSSGRTIDEELEKTNFQKAGEILASIWNGLVLDGHEVVAECVKNVEIDLMEFDDMWIANHCRVSQYLLQIVKCNDKECCQPWRTSWFSFFPDRFLPAPFPLHHNMTGPLIPTSADAVKVNCSFNTDLWQHIALQNMIPCDIRPVPYDFFVPPYKSV